MLRNSCQTLLISVLALASTPALATVLPTASMIPAPIPPSISDRGTLEIQGTPGEGQAWEFYYMRCERDSTGAFVRSGCSDYQTARLNRALRLRAGTYLLGLSKSSFSQVIEIKNGEQKVIELARLDFSKLPVGVRYSIFVDYANDPVAEKALGIATFGRAMESEIEAWNQVCKQYDNNPKTKNRDLMQACQARKSTDPGTWVSKQGAFQRINPDSSISLLEFSSWDGINWWEGNRRWITDSYMNSREFAVLPGVYGIKYLDHDGSTETVQNVHAE